MTNRKHTQNIPVSDLLSLLKGKLNEDPNLLEEIISDMPEDIVEEIIFNMPDHIVDKLFTHYGYSEIPDPPVEHYPKKMPSTGLISSLISASVISRVESILGGEKSSFNAAGVYAACAAFTPNSSELLCKVLANRNQTAQSSLLKALRGDETIASQQTSDTAENLLSKEEKQKIDNVLRHVNKTAKLKTQGTLDEYLVHHKGINE